MPKKEIQYCPPLNLNEFNRIYRDDITQREFKLLQQHINERADYVVRTAWQIMERKLDWWDFDNEDADSETHGYFDPESYRHEFQIVGNLGQPTNNFDKYQGDIPVKWLCENFEEALYLEYRVYKNKAIQDELARTAKEFNALKEVHAKIRAKLTKEELQHVKFV